ncbi:beta-lactamase family protein [Nonomuraea sp. PA05]|nr:beta-lactamase family protein [Nonomuraea sp. PA05]
MARKITEALDVPQDRPQLQQILQDMVEAGFVGVTLRVRDQRGEWAGSAGTTERGGTTPAPIDAHVRIGSNTKTFIATAVLRLVAEGRIALDAPVAGYLPEFGLDERITVRMLLQHTSGIFNFTGEYYEDGTFAPGIPATQAGKEWVDNRFHTYQPEDLVRLALSKPARFEPGTDWSYANTNYVLARLLIEKVTGRPVADELQRLILGPLGLTGTHQPTTETDLPAPHVHAYYRYDDTLVDVTRHNPSWISSGGDMISTSRDLQTFITALVTGKLLPADLLAEMFTPEAKAGYGLGVFVQNGGTLISHNGGNAGQAALMLCTADGATSLTATLAYVDDAEMSMGAAFQQASQRLLAEVFGPAA